MYASPEIEAWFIADWNDCVERIYGLSAYVPDLTDGERHFFLHRLLGLIKEGRDIEVSLKGIANKEVLEEL